MTDAPAPDEGRTYNLHVRLTTAEKDALNKAAQQCGLSVSELVRARVLGHRLRPKAEPEGGYQAMEPRLFAHLSRLGNNMNQIARAFNERGQIDHAQAIATVREVWEIMLTDEVTARHALGAEAKHRAGQRPARG